MRTHFQDTFANSHPETTNVASAVLVACFRTISVKVQTWPKILDVLQNKQGFRMVSVGMGQLPWSDAVSVPIPSSLLHGMARPKEHGYVDGEMRTHRPKWEYKQVQVAMANQIMTVLPTCTGNLKKEQAAYPAPLYNLVSLIPIYHHHHCLLLIYTSTCIRIYLHMWVWRCV